MMKKLLLICAIFLLGNQFIDAQNLVAGDIAIVGYRTDNPDGFTFITLKNIPGSEVIYFTDQGWTGSAWYVNTEDHLTWTAPAGGVTIGTLIMVSEIASDLHTVTLGTISLDGYTWSLSAGDQILAYQSTSGVRPTNPTFITGLHGDDNYGHNTGCEDPTTNWYSATGLCESYPQLPPSASASSVLPTGLTNGVNAVALFPNPKREVDNNRYNGTLTGDSDDIRISINTFSNWTGSDMSSEVSISPEVYATPSVTCYEPTVPLVTVSPSIVCDGNAALISFSGIKNNATTWTVYKGSCGGTLVGSTSGSASGGNLFVTPTAGSNTYFVRAEGGCTTPAACGSVTFTTTTREDASFSYGSVTYCATDADPTPTISGAGGGTFSSAGGLSINASSGTIDLSASTPGIYSVKYEVTGICDGNANFLVTVKGLEDASFSYATNTYVTNDSNPSPIISGLPAGSFSSTPAGLSISSETGIIDLANSTIGAYSVTYTTSGSSTSSSCSNSSDFSINITTSTGVKANLLSKEISIFPNPNKGRFTLSYSGQKQLKELIVNDITGNRVHSISLSNFAGSEEINLSTLTKGLYYITIQSESDKVTMKMIIK